VQDVRRCIVFCRQLKLPVLGVVENMSGFTCPHCNQQVEIFGADGGRKMADEMGVPYLGAIPIEPEVVVSGDTGAPVVQAKPHSETALAFGRIVRTLLEPELHDTEAHSKRAGEGQVMKIAVPVTGGELSQHFGHCEQFLLIETHADGKTLGRRQLLTPPAHEPGVFPQWLHAQGATVIIAGGMGSRAQSLFGKQGIEVVVGASGNDPERVVRDFLDGRLTTGANACDH